jgi:HEAT repeat protein
MKGALDALRDPDVGRQRSGADWLARAPRDEAQAVEVSKALDPLIRNAPADIFGHESARGEAISALKVWGTKENVPTLVDFLKAQIANDPHWIHIREQVTNAMDALATIGDDRAVDGIIPFAGTVHGIHLNGAPEAALRRMGPKAEKGLRRYANDPNQGIRDLAQRLLRELGNRRG